MTIKRELKAQVAKRIKPQKVMLIYGPRRVGKTLLLREIYNEFKGENPIIISSH